MHRLTAALVPALTFALAACRSNAAAAPAMAAGGGKAVDVATPKTVPADTDPCSWISAEEAARLLGPLDGAPWRADQSEQPQPDKKGHACGYTLAARSGAAPGGGDEKIAVELLTEGGTLEGGFAMVTGKLSKDVGQGVVGQVMKALGNDGKPAPGWDYTGQLPDRFEGRLGHIAIRVGIYSDRVPHDSIERLAALVRDRIPDLPFATPPKLLNRGEGPDPCGLLTRQEAEAVLGKLSIPPYRSNSHKEAFADPRGEGCSYYLGKHRVFTIDATWEQGKTIFGMVAGMGQKIPSVIGVNGEAADTLEGEWDQAGAGIDGPLYFLKGDRMLEVTYRTAGVDLAGAVRLARLAVKRLR